MKKIIAITTLVASLAATSGFAQGYFLFTTGKSQVFDGFTTPGASTTAATVDVTFLWAPATTTVSLPLTSTPTTGNSLTTESYTAASAWSAILGSGFTAAVNQNTSLAAVQLSAANGGVAYNTSGTFPVTGTVGNGSTAYSVFMVAWNASSGATTLAQAAADNASVGWSSVFQYTPAKDAITGVSGFTALSPNFGVFTPLSTPEPGTMALAALGGASLLMLRRKK
jgi:hypothetical protein